MATEAERLHALREERKKLTLTQAPLLTLKHSLLELIHLVGVGLRWLVGRVVPVTALLVLGTLACYVAERQAPGLVPAAGTTAYAVYYWIILGVLSSIGLGSGLHTFLIFVLPYLGYVSKKIYQCGSTDFTFPPLLGLRVIIPTGEHVHAWHQWYTTTPCGPTPPTDVSMWTVIHAIRWPVVLWGIGTAIGELPPYFVARGARLSEVPMDDEDLNEFHASLQDTSTAIMSRLKRGVHALVHRMGFLGIMLCASIPNPLFDLAGLTCGHFLIPFSTFFGATLLGKAVIKTHLQMFACVLLVSERVSRSVAEWTRAFPIVGESFSKAILAQSATMSNNLSQESVDMEGPPSNFVSKAMSVVVLLMVGYFLLSIISHLAQRNHKRLDTPSTTAETTKPKKE